MKDSALSICWRDTLLGMASRAYLFSRSLRRKCAGDRSVARAIAPSCHNAEQLGAKCVDRRSQHTLGLDARLARRVEPQQVHHDVVNDGQVVDGIAAAHP